MSVVASPGVRVVSCVPTCRIVSEPDVSRAITVVDDPEPTVILSPGSRVCEPTTKPDADAVTG